MKIGIFISPAHTVPPHEKNILAPWELARDLTDGLVLRGHHVHLFCAEGSETSAIQHSFGITAAITLKTTLPPDRYRAVVREREHELFQHMMDTAEKEGLDIIHVHQRLEGMKEELLLLGRSIPCVATFHEPITKDRYPALQEIQKKTGTAYVSISDAQRADAPFPFIATVYHGISLSVYTYKEDVGDAASQFLIVGRVVPDKGFSDAIEAVQKTGEKLMILGQVYPEQPFSSDYYKQYIQPAVDGKSISMEGVIARDRVVEQYQRAKALFFPIHWEEPFGLAMIEAMACGTPVIAYARGSVPEVVVDGVTGFIVNESEENKRGEWSIKRTGVEGLAEAVTRLETMSKKEYVMMRRACRKHVEEHFSIDRMITGYERVYENILKPAHTRCVQGE